MSYQTVNCAYLLNKFTLVMLKQLIISVPYVLQTVPFIFPYLKNYNCKISYLMLAEARWRHNICLLLKFLHAFVSSNVLHVWWIFTWWCLMDLYGVFMWTDHLTNVNTYCLWLCCIKAGLAWESKSIFLWKESDNPK